MAFPGELNLLADSKQVFDSNCFDVWYDGSFSPFLFVASFHGIAAEGLRTYSVNPTGGFTLLDYDYQGPGGPSNFYWSVYGDGTFVYVACGNDGLRSYSVDPSGGLTPLGHIDDGGSYTGVWADVNFVYAACGNLNGLRTYSVDGSGNFTLLDTDWQSGTYQDVWGDGNFIYVACGGGGIRSYTVDGGGVLQHKDVDLTGSDYQEVWGDGNFIYTVDRVGFGLMSYSVDVDGIFTFIDNDYPAGGVFEGVWGDGDWIYTTSVTTINSRGLFSYGVDIGGNLTLKDNDWYGTPLSRQYRRIWGDGTFVYVAYSTVGGNGGVLSYGAEASSSSSSSSYSQSSSSSSSSSSQSSSSSSSSISSSSSSSSSSSISSSSSSSLSSSSTSSTSISFSCPEYIGREFKTWPCNINDTTNEIMIISWCISSSSSSSSVSSSSTSSSSESFSSSSVSSSSSSTSQSSSSSSSSASNSSSSSSVSYNLAYSMLGGLGNGGVTEVDEDWETCVVSVEGYSFYQNNNPITRSTFVNPSQNINFPDPYYTNTRAFMFYSYNGGFQKVITKAVLSGWLGGDDDIKDAYHFPITLRLYEATTGVIWVGNALTWAYNGSIFNYTDMSEGDYNSFILNPHFAEYTLEDYPGSSDPPYRIDFHFNQDGLDYLTTQHANVPIGFPLSVGPSAGDMTVQLAMLESSDYRTLIGDIRDPAIDEIGPRICNMVRWDFPPVIEILSHGLRLWASSSSSSVSSSSESSSSSSVSFSSSSSSVSSSSSSVSSSSTSVAPLLVYSPSASESFRSDSLGLIPPSGSVDDVAIVKSNSMMVFWSEPISEGIIKNIDLDGSNNFSQRVNGLIGREDVAINKLQNGNIALVTSTQFTGTSGAIVSPSGSIVINSFQIDTGGGTGNQSDCIALLDGNWVAMYTDHSGGLPILGKFRIYDPSGSAVTAVTQFDNQSVMARGATLVDGNFVIATYDYINDGSYFLIYNSSGSLVTSKTLVGLNGQNKGLSVVPTSAGFIIGWFEENGSTDNKIMLSKYTLSGGFVSTVTVDDPPTTSTSPDPYDTWLLATVFKLDDGRIGVVGYSNGRRYFYYWVYDQDLNLIQVRHHYIPEVSNDISSTLRIASFGNGKYGVATLKGLGAGGLNADRVFVDVLEETV